MSLTIGASQAAQQAFLQPEANASRPVPGNLRAPVADGVSRILSATSQRPVPDDGNGSSGGRELVASEDSVTAGSHRDAYDLQLYREPDGTYTLELEMKIEFNFEDGADGLNWTPEEKRQFIEDYKQAVEDAWSGRTITTDDGQQVTLDINLDVSEQPGGFWGGIKDAVDPSENWNINVVKADKFTQSSVTRGENTGNFDSLDVNPVPKGAADDQVAAAHEFGHMIGLPDEYNGNGGQDAANDTDSIMHSGMDLRERHLDAMESWAEEHL